MPEQEQEKPLDEYFIQAMMLAEVVKRVLNRRGHVKLSQPPEINLKPVTEFMKRMRVTSLEKFDQETYISTINFYDSQESLDKKKAVGVIVFYIAEDYIPELLNRLNYPIYDEGDPDELQDAGGTFCNLIAGNFKSGLTQLGYGELVMSHFTSYRNEVLNGVEYCLEQDQKYEICFEIEGTTRIIADFNMGKLSKV